MADPKEALNMGSSRTANTIADLDRGISGLIQKSSLLSQAWTGINSIMSSASSRFRGVFGGGGDGGTSASQIAPNPKFSSPAIQTMGYNTPSGMSIAAGPVPTGTPGSGFNEGVNLTEYVNRNPSAGTAYQPVAEMSGGSVVRSTGGTGGGGGGGTSGGVGSVDPEDPGANSGATRESRFFGNTLGSLFSPRTLGGVLNVYGLASNLVPATADVVESNLLLSRAQFYSGQAYGSVVGQNARLAQLATLSGDNPALDVMRAMSAAQSYGIVSPNFNEVLGGAAAISNLIPGVGVEGAVRATGAMQQARNVNLLRGIGIQIRDANGDLKPADQVIEDVWNKICRDYSQAYGANKKPSLREVQIALQPGNSLDSMLDMYFGNDPMLKQLVANGLIFKARTGGAAITKATVEAEGGTTAAVTAFSQRNAAMAGLLGGLDVTGAFTGVGGFIKANQLLSTLIDTAGKAMAAIFLPIKTFTDTILAAAGGVGGNILGELAGFAKAEGGPVSGNRTYLVGEKGPEIFVPTTDGYIIPNHEIAKGMGATGNSTQNNTYNFTVNVPNANTPEVIAALRNLISELETNKRVSES